MVKRHFIDAARGAAAAEPPALFKDNGADAGSNEPAGAGKPCNSGSDDGDMP
jgi:hypothetical protein